MVFPVFLLALLFLLPLAIAIAMMNVRAKRSVAGTARRGWKLLAAFLGTVVLILLWTVYSLYQE